MRILPFCSENLKDIKKEAREIHGLLTDNWLFQDCGADFTVDDFLNAFACVTGYTSWGGVIAKNRETRSYPPFSFAKYAHVSCYADEIARRLNLSKKHLLAAASLLALGGAFSKDNLYVMPNETDVDYHGEEEIVLVIGKDPGDRDYRF